MVDVCLVVEGSYPYVTGGVSQWVDAVLRAHPDVRFAVAHVSDEVVPSHASVYDLPANTRLVHVPVDPDPLIPPAGAEDRLPEARVYHAACTGAAGELARRVAAGSGAGFAITEHGIAWREAWWAPAGCKGGSNQGVFGCKGGSNQGVFGCKGGWNHGVFGCKGGSNQGVFGCKGGSNQGELPVWTPAERDAHAAAIGRMARATYAEADAITSVCGPNARLQRAAGAPAPRLRVIPNPVEAPDGGPEEHDGLLIGFVGRVVAIKDVETLLRSWALVAEARRDARFVVVGPTHHEPDYADACVALARELGLGDRITFTGTAAPAPWYRRMDALTLTSLSEAQPLVALEAMAHGVPVVATDVGGCREAIGDAGLLTPSGSPRATARALLRVASDDALRDALGRAGRRRAATTHAPARVHGAYRELWERLAA